MAEGLVQDPSKHVPDEAVLEPFKYIMASPGKDIRGKLIDCFVKWLPLEAKQIEIIKSIVGELHNASLLVDDIEDGSLLRRGQPVAHTIYGVPMTLNCANYVYFTALEHCNALDSKRAMNVFILELLNLHRGQGQDILWRDTVRCPTLAQYEQMVLDKTGGLFRLAVGLMQALSADNHEKAKAAKPNEGIAPLVNALALYFQIRDDLVNLRDDKYMQSKSFCEDLTEGKFSYPIIHAILADEKDTRLLNILKQRTESVPMKQHAVEYMKSKGSFKATGVKLAEIYQEIQDEIKKLGGHEMLSLVIAGLNKQVVEVEEKDDPDGLSSPFAPPARQVTPSPAAPLDVP